MTDWIDLAKTFGVPIVTGLLAWFASRHKTQAEIRKVNADTDSTLSSAEARFRDDLTEREQRLYERMAALEELLAASMGRENSLFRENAEMRALQQLHNRQIEDMSNNQTILLAERERLKAEVADLRRQLASVERRTTGLESPGMAAAGGAT